MAHIKLRKKSANEAGVKLDKWLGEIPVGETAIAKYRLTEDRRGEIVGEIQMRLNDETLNGLKSVQKGIGVPQGRLSIYIWFNDPEKYSAKTVAGKMSGCTLNLATNIMNNQKDFWFGPSTAANIAQKITPIFEDVADPSVYEKAAQEITAILKPIIDAEFSGGNPPA